MPKKLLFIFLLALCGMAAHAQAVTQDSAKVKSKTVNPKTGTDSVPALKPFRPQPSKVKVYHPDSLHSPHKAIMHSLMIPGWGQIYNRQWWKVPVLYGGFALLGAAIIYNQHYYHIYVTEAKALEYGLKPPYADLPTQLGYQAFFDAAAANQRDLQLSILGILGAWGINIIDAYINAQFQHSYSMDNNLSFKVSPTLINQSTFASANNSYVAGIKLTLTL